VLLFWRGGKKRVKKKDRLYWLSETCIQSCTWVFSGVEKKKGEKKQAVGTSRQEKALQKSEVRHEKTAAEKGGQDG